MEVTVSQVHCKKHGLQPLSYPYGLCIECAIEAEQHIGKGRCETHRTITYEGVPCPKCKEAK